MYHLFAPSYSNTITLFLLKDTIWLLFIFSNKNCYSLLKVHYINNFLKVMKNSICQFFLGDGALFLQKFYKISKLQCG